VRCSEKPELEEKEQLLEEQEGRFRRYKSRSPRFRADRQTCRKPSRRRSSWRSAAPAQISVISLPMILQL